MDLFNNNNNSGDGDNNNNNDDNNNIIAFKQVHAYSKTSIDSPSWNKRAQRALGRSPEEKVKGHSGSNNREPQGHNLNNFGRGPFDDVIY